MFYEFIYRQLAFRYFKCAHFSTQFASSSIAKQTIMITTEFAWSTTILQMVIRESERTFRIGIRNSVSKTKWQMIHTQKIRPLKPKKLIFWQTVHCFAKYMTSVELIWPNPRCHLIFGENLVKINYSTMHNIIV